ncbi:cytochrome c551 [Salimicrobium flavidum]|uniref:Cytochrome c551 n=1 Tax=Salimicrobium flavidum TaxID=570947 RepID=A0A1N7J1A8_9BACI|nr:cytochrome c [Salimicrobium flavidum]SIS43079.1 cytochrome c551 [Salimicrobium flavidum]
MKWKLLSVLFVAMLVLAACGGGGGDESSDDSGGDDTTTEEQEGMDEGNGDSGDSGGEMDSAAAEEAYQTNCSSCHGGDLGGGVGPALDSVGADYSEDEIVDIIQNGNGDMPAQDVDDETAQQIAGWLAQKQ